jgi:hypothetical protein
MNEKQAMHLDYFYALKRMSCAINFSPWIESFDDNDDDEAPYWRDCEIFGEELCEKQAKEIIINQALKLLYAFGYDHTTYHPTDWDRVRDEMLKKESNREGCKTVD